MSEAENNESVKNNSNNSNKSKFIILSIIIAVLSVILVIALIANGRRNVNKVSSGLVQAESMSENSIGVLKGDSRFLVVCTENKSSNVIFMDLVDFNLYSGTMVITPLDPSTPSLGTTYFQTFSYGGMQALLESVKSKRRCTIDRYIQMDKSGFGSIIDSMGNVMMTVGENYTYESSDKSYEVTHGENDMNSAMVYAYLKVLSEKPNGYIAIADTIKYIVNVYFSETDMSDPKTLFSRFSNFINTDLTVFDFNSCEDGIGYFVTHSPSCIIEDEMYK